MKDLLLRLQRALPLMERWVDEVRVEHLAGSSPVARAGSTRLASCFPPLLLERTRFRVVDALPFPPVADYGLHEFEGMAPASMSAITFDDIYFVRPSHFSEALHFHELVHVVQWKTLGIREFLLTYALGLAQYGYDHSPLETLAYDLQKRFEQGKITRTVVHEVATHSVEVRNAAAAVFEAHGLPMGSDRIAMRRSGRAN